MCWKATAFLASTNSGVGGGSPFGNISHRSCRTHHGRPYIHHCEVLFGSYI